MVEVTAHQLRQEDVDVVVLQRPHEAGLAEGWLGRRPGRDVPAVYVEHNTPKGEILAARHPIADRDDLTLVHVTHFNRLFWDNGRAPTTVIEHGVVDPGARYTGELPGPPSSSTSPSAAGASLVPTCCPRSPPPRRWTFSGCELRISRRHFCSSRTGSRPTHLPQEELHDQMAQRRVYVHPIRWTSLGLSLLEAMHLAMPVVVLASTEAVEAVPPDAGVISTRLDDSSGRPRYVATRSLPSGRQAARAALARYSLRRFVDDWDCCSRR